MPRSPRYKGVGTGPLWARLKADVQMATGAVQLMISYYRAGTVNFADLLHSCRSWSGAGTEFTGHSAKKQHKRGVASVRVDARSPKRSLQRPHLGSHHPGDVHGHRLGPVRPVPCAHAVAVPVILRRLSLIAAAIRAVIITAAVVERDAAARLPVPGFVPLAAVAPAAALQPALISLRRRLRQPC